MKKSYLLIAAAATVLASCSQNEKLQDINIPAEEPTVIGFNTYSQKATRATEVLEGYHTTFAVYASKKSTVAPSDPAESVFDGDIITYQAGAQDPNNWTYTPYRYWDRQADYTFFAVAPNANIVEYNYASTCVDLVNDVNGDYKTKSAGYTLIGQNLQTTPAAAEKKTGFYGADGQDTDLMTATKNDQDGRNHTTDVEMEFKHILAKLNVSVAKDAGLDNVKVLVKSVEITGLDDKGAYAEKNYTGTVSGWTSSKSENNANYKLTYSNTEGFELPASTLSGTQRVPTPRYFIESLVMPQSIENKGEKMVIKYEIVSGPSTAPHTEKYTYQLYFKDGTDVVFANFMDRNNYTLKLTISPNTITFDANATTWVDNLAEKEIIPTDPE